MSDQLPAPRLTKVYRLVVVGGRRPGGVTYETYLVE